MSRIVTPRLPRTRIELVQGTNECAMAVVVLYYVPALTDWMDSDRSRYGARIHGVFWWSCCGDPLKPFRWCKPRGFLVAASRGRLPAVDPFLNLGRAPADVSADQPERPRKLAALHHSPDRGSGHTGSIKDLRGSQNLVFHRSSGSCMRPGVALYHRVTMSGVIYRSVSLSGTVLAPRFHDRPPTVQQIRPRIGLFDIVPDGMSEREFRQHPIYARLTAPVPER